MHERSQFGADPGFAMRGGMIERIGALESKAETMAVISRRSAVDTSVGHGPMTTPAAVEQVMKLRCG